LKGMATLIATYSAANIAVRAICLLVILFICLNNFAF
jgi:hypothetical protein